MKERNSHLQLGMDALVNVIMDALVAWMQTVPCAVPQSDLKEDEGGVSQLKPCRLLEHGKSWRLRFCRQYGDILLDFSRE